MNAVPDPFWFLVIAAAALAGWWLSVRPRATYRSVSTTMSALIVLMAILLCVLAINGQWGLPAAVRAPSLSGAHPAAKPAAPAAVHPDS